MINVEPASGDNVVIVTFNLVKTSEEFRVKVSDLALIKTVESEIKSRQVF